MKLLKYSCMILLSVFISCDSDDDDDHHDPNWSYRRQQPHESLEFKEQSAKLVTLAYKNANG